MFVLNFSSHYFYVLIYSLNNSILRKYCRWQWNSILKYTKHLFSDFVIKEKFLTIFSLYFEKEIQLGCVLDTIWWFFETKNLFSQRWCFYVIWSLRKTNLFHNSRDPNGPLRTLREVRPRLLNRKSWEQR